MTPEEQFYKKEVKPYLESWGDHSRIENSISSGMPDINYAIEGTQGWLELKVIKSGYLWFEKFQLPWHRKRLRHLKDKGIYVLATSDKGDLYLWDSKAIIEAEKEYRKDWVLVKVVGGPKPLIHSIAKPWAWGQILSILANYHVYKNTGML